MHVVHVEHPVRDFDAWKRVFDSDPAGRRQAGVRRYRVLRAADDPNVVMIDLELDTEQEAEAMLRSLQALWRRVDGVLVDGPCGRVFEVHETVDT